MELPKFKKKKRELVGFTEKWAFFLKHAPEMDEKDVALVVGPDQIIAKAYEVVNRFHWNRASVIGTDQGRGKYGG